MESLPSVIVTDIVNSPEEPASGTWSKAMFRVGERATANSPFASEFKVSADNELPYIAKSTAVPASIAFKP